jgi:hypothetical protein
MRNLLLSVMLFLCSNHCVSQVSTNNAKRINNTLYDVLDINTGQIFSFSKVDKYLDGKLMDISMCDDVIYIKYNNEYFKRNYEGLLNIRWFGCNESMSGNQVIINKILAKYKKAYIPEGVYKFSGTIVVPEKSSLLGSGNAAVLKLVSKQPATGIILSRWGSLKGFKLDCTETNMDVSAAVLVNAWNDVESDLGELGIQDIVITGNYPQLQGVALKLAIQPEKDKSYSVINFCKFSNIDIYGFRDGIFCSLEYEKGKNISYINANIFENIIIHKCLRPVRLINTADETDVVSGKSAIAFNSFENIFIQHVVGDYAAITADGASYNKINAQIIDWIGNNIENSRKSKSNIINTALPGDSLKIKNN